MYTEQVINKTIGRINTKYFKVISEEGEVLHMDRLFNNESDKKSSLYIPSGFSDSRIIFKIDDVYNRLDYLANFFPRPYDFGLTFDYTRDFGLSINTLEGLGYNQRDYTELDYWQFYINTIPDITYKTRKAYIKNLPYSMTKRRGNQFDMLFERGVHIDLNHIHGGEHNEQILFHVSDEYDYGVKWLAGLFGLPYQSTLTRVFPTNRKAHIRFDSSGADCSHLRFLKELFEITCTTGKRGRALLTELGGCVVTNQKGVSYDYEKEFPISFKIKNEKRGYRWRDKDRRIHIRFSDIPHVWSPKYKDYVRPFHGMLRGLSGNYYEEYMC